MMGQARITLLGLLAILWGIGALPALAAPRHRDETLMAAQRLVAEWRVEAAAQLLAPLIASRSRDPEMELVRGQLQFYQGDYDGAVRSLRAGLAGLRLPPAESQELRSISELAAASAEVTRGFAEQRSPGGHFVIRYRRGRDEILVPYAAEALEKAWAALGEDFAGIADAEAARPAGPVRVEIYEDITDLARVSTLTIKEIETSGTIALCKWNRLMIVSPRALLRGYPWIDTLTHEYTHYIVTRVARGTVPIWLHEGLAKFEERRWRGPSGGGLTPTLESLLAGALAKKRFITFEQMSPSMAKLPSQEDTALAFAEVYSVVEYLHSKLGWAGLRRLLSELAHGNGDKGALAAVYGGPFVEFDRAWKSWLRSRKLRTRAGMYTPRLRFKKTPGQPAAQAGRSGSPPAPQDDDDSGEIGDPKARSFVRLGGLLRARGRLLPAAMEYEKAQGILGAGHPLLALKLGRTYLELGDLDHAISSLEPARESYTDLPGINAALGSAWLKKGEVRKAVPYLEAAIATSPFDPSIHCGLVQAYKQLQSPLAERAAAACSLLGGR